MIDIPWWRRRRSQSKRVSCSLQQVPGAFHTDCFFHDNRDLIKRAQHAHLSSRCSGGRWAHRIIAVERVFDTRLNTTRWPGNCNRKRHQKGETWMTHIHAVNRSWPATLHRMCFFLDSASKRPASAGKSNPNPNESNALFQSTTTPSQMVTGVRHRGLCSLIALRL